MVGLIQYVILEVYLLSMSLNQFKFEKTMPELILNLKVV